MARRSKVDPNIFVFLVAIIVGIFVFVDVTSGDSILMGLFVTETQRERARIPGFDDIRDARRRNAGGRRPNR